MDAKKLLEDLMDFDKDNIPDKVGLGEGSSRWVKDVFSNLEGVMLTFSFSFFFK